MDALKCVFCHELLAGEQETSTFGAKGCEGITKASDDRGRTDIKVQPGQVVHLKCRIDYVNANCIKKDKRKRPYCDEDADEEFPCALRSAESKFSYKEDCIFCGFPDIYKGKKLESRLIAVRSMDFKVRILEACTQYENDWTNTVKRRVLYADDLPAKDVVYHQSCSVNFRTGKQVPKIFQPREVEKPPKSRKIQDTGRPLDSRRSEAFVKVAEYLEENDDEQVTINDLINKMGDYMESGTEPYSFPYMKSKIKKHFGDRIMITELNGKSNVVTFHTTASKIMHDFKYEAKDSDDKMHIVKTAAKLIKQDIKDNKQTVDTYPDYNDISNDKALQWVPTSLRTFLETIFCGKDTDTKIASIGQAIMQAARPRILLAPLQIGLGIQMHHHFQSRFLVDSLHEHGFCSSYSEVKKFERCASVTQGTEIPTFDQHHFIQYVADNVDHNVRSIDGKGTFHGMGIIATVTPATKMSRSVRRVAVTAEDVTAVGHVNIHNYFSERGSLETMRYETLTNPDVEEPFTDFDLLWKFSLMTNVRRPQWSGFMQMVHKGHHPGQSSVMFLPMLDLDPNDLSCIFSTLKFVCSHAKDYNATPVITFDQPLWWKAHTMVESEPKGSLIHSSIIRLGGFHTEMSFLGCIGHLMGGSGIQELLEVIYASNTVGHMLSGKAISRAVRGHLLVDAALNTILAAKVLGKVIPRVLCSEAEVQGDDTSNATDLTDEGNSEDLQSLTSQLKDVLSGLSTDDVKDQEILNRIGEKLTEEKTNVANTRTGKLWIQYMDMVDLLCKFIKGERLGNWALHLQSMYDMLPYFAASGHNLYLKSVHIYLQKMSKLEIEHPNVFEHFSNGLHVMRRSDRQWAGLSTDLAIEQCLMRSLKTTGGLTRGSGMTEVQRLIWVLSTPACAEMNTAMQEFTGVTYTTSEQHKETTNARIDRDLGDAQEVLQYLDMRSPFNTESPTALRNISTGITAHSNVNADDARTVGLKVLESMSDKKVIDHVFKKRDQAITMDTKCTVKIKGEEVQIDPQLLFQRLITAGTRRDELANTFSYELCAYPPALFESKTLMNKATKSNLTDALWSQALAACPQPPDQSDCVYVLDGGALLHKIPWQKGSTWEEICEMYATYICNKYDNATIVVFDGYTEGPSTKDCAHMRRNGGNIGPTVLFTSDMTLQTTKDVFLSNNLNKQRFINMLGRKLESHGIEVHHATGDADLLIVQTAVLVADKKDAILVGDDTDLLVLLLFHAKQTRYNIWFKPSQKKKGKHKELRCWNISATRCHLGNLICDCILFIHAITGCDTTSRVFGIGKGVSVEKVKSDAEFAKQANVFMKSTSRKKDVIRAGELAIVSLCNGKTGDDLNTMRLKRFYEKTSSSTAMVQPQTLPPTSAAVKYHSLRVYQQVQVWAGNEDKFPPEEWGWRVVDAQMVPVLTDIAPAPQELLEIIRCGCKTGCYTLRCTCRKNGTECSLACGECKGVCSNTTSLHNTEIESDDEA